MNGPDMTPRAMIFRATLALAAIEAGQPVRAVLDHRLKGGPVSPLALCWHEALWAALTATGCSLGEAGRLAGIAKQSVQAIRDSVEERRGEDRRTAVRLALLERFFRELEAGDGGP